jgi:hypothetical protein
MRPAQRAWLWPGVFLACVAAAGARSVLLGKDASWDLRNYHWYNPWALLNGRLGFDLAPAQLQTYHNPLADLPFYALVQVSADPRLVAFAMGLPSALAAFFLVRILALLFPFDRTRANGIAWVAAAAAIGLTGAAGTATWGTTMNEWPPAALAMAALWLAIRAAVEGEARRRFACAAAGFLMGCAVGLKLTYAVFAIGLLLGCAGYGTFRARLMRPLLSGAFLALGFLACYGWWGLTLWREFANPFFPYFNAFFQSPWWEPVDYFDRNFGPRDWKQWIFFPLYFAHRGAFVSELEFRDYRLAALLAAALAAWAVARYRNLRENPNAAAPPPEPTAPAWRVLAIFTLASYVSWLQLFGIYRYLVPLELVSGALIVGCALYVFRQGRLRMALVAVLAVALVAGTRPWDPGRVAFGDAYFDVRAPRLPGGALVIVGYRHPMAYAIPFFGPGARFVSPANNFLAPGQRNRLAEHAAALIRDHPGPRYLLEYKERNAHDERTLQHFGLVAVDSECIPVRSSFDEDHMRICPLRPAGSR